MEMSYGECLIHVGSEGLIASDDEINTAEWSIRDGKIVDMGDMAYSPSSH